MTHVVMSPCIGTKDTACVQVCPVDCFFDIGEMLIIHPEECIDCGACVDECPVSQDVPAYMRAVREGDWKLLGSEGGPKMTLHRLSDDQPEVRDHAPEQPQRVARLKMLHDEWLKDVTPE